MGGGDGGVGFDDGGIDVGGIGDMLQFFGVVIVEVEEEFFVVWDLVKVQDEVLQQIVMQVEVKDYMQFVGVGRLLVDDKSEFYWVWYMKEGDWKVQ